MCQGFWVQGTVIRQHMGQDGRDPRRQSETRSGENPEADEVGVRRYFKVDAF